MTDTNECRLSGTIERMKSVPTKSGAAMAGIILHVRQDRFRVVAHGNVAEHILSRGKAGDRLSISGTMSVSNWKDEATGEWRNSFSVTAWSVEIGGENVAYERKQQSASSSRRQQYEPPTVHQSAPF